MERATTVISPQDIQIQLDHCQAVAQLNARLPQPPLAFVDTYGCQQNEADSERIRGYLARMGYGFTQDEEEARVIVINTCAIREHAEQRVLGNLGALVHTKRRHPDQLICLCGCMAQEPRIAEKIRQSYRHVDLVFGPTPCGSSPRCSIPCSPTGAASSRPPTRPAPSPRASRWSARTR